MDTHKAYQLTTFGSFQTCFYFYFMLFGPLTSSKNIPRQESPSSFAGESVTAHCAPPKRAFCRTRHPFLLFVRISKLCGEPGLAAAETCWGCYTRVCLVCRPSCLHSGASVDADDPRQSVAEPPEVCLAPQVPQHMY